MNYQECLLQLDQFRYLIGTDVTFNERVYEVLDVIVIPPEDLIMVFADEYHIRHNDNVINRFATRTDLEIGLD
jgi:hypothetical protein